MSVVVTSAYTSKCAEPNCIEEQAVSARWRVLTRTHIQRLFNEPPHLTDYFIDAFVNILISAGVKDAQDEEHLRSAVADKIGDRVTLVTQSAIHLNKVIGEGVTSCELLTLYVVPEAPFDYATMDDTFNRPNSREKEARTAENILCTTDLGLLRAEKVKGKEGEWDKLILLKPKVILESGLILEDMYLC